MRLNQRSKRNAVFIWDKGNLFREPTSCDDMACPDLSTKKESDEQTTSTTVLPTTETPARTPAISEHGVSISSGTVNDRESGERDHARD